MLMVVALIIANSPALAESFETEDDPYMAKAEEKFSLRELATLLTSKRVTGSPSTSLLSP